MGKYATYESDMLKECYLFDKDATWNAHKSGIRKMQFTDYNNKP